MEAGWGYSGMHRKDGYLADLKAKPLPAATKALLKDIAEQAIEAYLEEQAKRRRDQEEAEGARGTQESQDGRGQGQAESDPQRGVKCGVTNLANRRALAPRPVSRFRPQWPLVVFCSAMPRLSSPSAVKVSRRVCEE